MKRFATGILLSLFFTPSVLSELTPEDLQAIRAIIKEEIVKSEARNDLKLAAIKTELAVIKTEIKGIDKRLDNQQTWILALFAFLAVVVATPYVVLTYHGKKIGQFNTELTTVKIQTEALSQQTQEINRLAQDVNRGMANFLESQAPTE